MWQLVQNLVAARHKGRVLCQWLDRKGWGQPVGEFPMFWCSAVTWKVCVLFGVKDLPCNHWVRHSLRAWGGCSALTASRITEAVVLCWVVLQHWGFLCRVGETAAPLVCWEIFPCLSWAIWLLGSDRWDVEPSYLAALCEALSGSVHPENAVLCCQTWGISLDYKFWQNSGMNSVPGFSALSRIKQFWVWLARDSLVSREFYWEKHLKFRQFQNWGAVEEGKWEAEDLNVAQLCLK